MQHPDLTEQDERDAETKILKAAFLAFEKGDLPETTKECVRQILYSLKHAKSVEKAINDDLHKSGRCGVHIATKACITAYGMKLYGALGPNEFNPEWRVESIVYEQLIALCHIMSIFESISNAICAIGYISDEDIMSWQHHDLATELLNEYER